MGPLGVSRAGTFCVGNLALKSAVSLSLANSNAGTSIEIPAYCAAIKDLNARGFSVQEAPQREDDYQATNKKNPVRGTDAGDPRV